MTARPVVVGIVGAGDVSGQYLTAFANYPDVQVAGITDVDADRATARAAEFGVPAAPTVETLLADPAVELMVNLTPPAEHTAVSLAAICRGKHVWCEKPLGTERVSAREVLEAAAQHGVFVGCAPDTVLGRGIQSSALHLAQAAVGPPKTLLTLMQGPGPESWHPRPEFFFRKGAGPLFDIGPYYVTTMVMLLGPILRVTAVGTRTRPTRVIGTGPRAGQSFEVDVATHVGVLTEFVSGAVGTSVYSFDSPIRRQQFEVTGPEGTLSVPVSGFDGPSELYSGSDPEGAADSIRPIGTVRDRGVGVVEMARAIRADRPPRASGELAFHTLDVLLAIEESVAYGGAVAVQSRAPVVEPLDSDWDPQRPTL